MDLASAGWECGRDGYRPLLILPFTRSPCWFTCAAIAGTVPALVEGGRPLLGSLTKVKRASGDGQPRNVHRELLIFPPPPARVVSELVGGCKDDNATVFHSMPWMGRAGGFGGGFGHGAGNVSSSQAARW